MDEASAWHEAPTNGPLPEVLWKSFHLEVGSLSPSWVWIGVVTIWPPEYRMLVSRPGLQGLTASSTYLVLSSQSLMDWLWHHTLETTVLKEEAKLGIKKLFSWVQSLTRGWRTGFVTTQNTADGSDPKGLLAYHSSGFPSLLWSKRTGGRRK